MPQVHSFFVKSDNGRVEMTGMEWADWLHVYQLDQKPYKDIMDPVIRGDYLQQQEQKIRQKSNRTGPLTPEEVRRAQQMWIKDQKSAHVMTEKDAAEFARRAKCFFDSLNVAVTTKENAAFERTLQKAVTKNGTPIPDEIRERICASFTSMETCFDPQTAQRYRKIITQIIEKSNLQQKQAIKDPESGSGVDWEKVARECEDKAERAHRVDKIRGNDELSHLRKAYFMAGKGIVTKLAGGGLAAVTSLRKLDGLGTAIAFIGWAASTIAAIAAFKKARDTAKKKVLELKTGRTGVTQAVHVQRKELDTVGDAVKAQFIEAKKLVAKTKDPLFFKIGTDVIGIREEVSPVTKRQEVTIYLARNSYVKDPEFFTKAKKVSPEDLVQTYRAMTETSFVSGKVPNRGLAVPTVEHPEKLLQSVQQYVENGIEAGTIGNHLKSQLNALQEDVKKTGTTMSFKIGDDKVKIKKKVDEKTKKEEIVIWHTTSSANNPKPQDKKVSIEELVDFYKNLTAQDFKAGSYVNAGLPAPTAEEPLATFQEVDKRVTLAQAQALQKANAR